MRGAQNNGPPEPADPTPSQARNVIASQSQSHHHDNPKQNPLEPLDSDHPRNAGYRAPFGRSASPISSSICAAMEPRRNNKSGDTIADEDRSQVPLILRTPGQGLKERVIRRGSKLSFARCEEPICASTVNSTAAISGIVTRSYVISRIISPDIVTVAPIRSAPSATPLQDAVLHLVAAHPDIADSSSLCTLNYFRGPCDWSPGAPAIFLC